VIKSHGSEQVSQSAGTKKLGQVKISKTNKPESLLKHRKDYQLLSKPESDFISGINLSKTWVLGGWQPV